METIRLKNIKAFKDSGEIEIKPLTIFVGENSSGKSSLLRFLPVMAQTFQEDVLTPLLFFGKWIDYGNFESVAYNSIEEDLIFEFSIKSLEILKYSFNVRNLNYLKELRRKIQKSRKIKCEVKLFKNKRKIQVKSFKIFLLDEELVSINFENNKYIIESNFLNEINGIKLFLEFNRFIPKMNERASSISLKESLKEKFHDKSKEQIENTLRFLTKIDYYGDSIYLKENLNEKEIQMIENISKAKSEYEFISMIFRGIDRYFKIYSSTLTYIGPFRNDPERVYRESESTYKNVGIRGENTSFVLKQSYNEKTDLLEKVSEWLNSSLGIRLNIKEVYENNLFEIKVKGENDHEANLIDVGYGISQVLPIISELYKEKEVRARDEISMFINRNQTETILIEQPELHLHPKAQSNLAELFIERIQAGKKLIVETHSEHLIRKLQVLIANPDIKFSERDLAIYYIHKTEVGSVAKRMELNSQGQFLTQWPTGFFDRGSQLNMELLGFLMGDKK